MLIEDMDLNLGKFKVVDIIRKELTNSYHSLNSNYIFNTFINNDLNNRIIYTIQNFTLHITKQSTEESIFKDIKEFSNKPTHEPTGDLYINLGNRWFVFFLAYGYDDRREIKYDLVRSFIAHQISLNKPKNFEGLINIKVSLDPVKVENDVDSEYLIKLVRKYGR